MSSQLGLRPHTNPRFLAWWPLGDTCPCPSPSPTLNSKSRPKDSFWGFKASVGRVSQARFPPPQHSVKHVWLLEHEETPLGASPPHLGPRSASQTRSRSADSASSFKSGPGLALSLAAAGSRAPGFTSLHLSVTGRWVGGGWRRRQSGSWGEWGGWGGWGGGRQPFSPSAPSSADQCTGQDGEAGPAQGASQGRAAAEEPEQEGGDGLGQEVQASEENLEGEDVAPQVLQVEDYPIVRDGEEEAMGG